MHRVLYGLAIQISPTRTRGRRSGCCCSAYADPYLLRNICVPEDTNALRQGLLRALDEDGARGRGGHLHGHTGGAELGQQLTRLHTRNAAGDADEHLQHRALTACWLPRLVCCGRAHRWRRCQAASFSITLWVLTRPACLRLTVRAAPGSRLAAVASAPRGLQPRLHLLHACTRRLIGCSSYTQTPRQQRTGTTPSSCSHGDARRARSARRTLPLAMLCLVRAIFSWRKHASSLYLSAVHSEKSTLLSRLASAEQALYSRMRPAHAGCSDSIRAGIPGATRRAASCTLHQACRILLGNGSRQRRSLVCWSREWTGVGAIQTWVHSRGHTIGARSSWWRTGCSVVAVVGQGACERRANGEHERTVQGLARRPSRSLTARRARQHQAARVQQRRSLERGKRCEAR